MRDPNRLDKFYDELKKIHKEHFPDWRFGQLVINLYDWASLLNKVDLFFPEEDRMIELVKEYVRYTHG